MFQTKTPVSMFARSILLPAALLAALVLAPHVHAAGVVGTGTPESCTEAALDTALAGGGTVTFDCGAGDTLIPITSTKTIAADTTIDGDSDIILRAANVRHFQVEAGVHFTLLALSLTDQGNGSEGAISNEGTTTLQDVTIRGIRSGEAAINNEPEATLLVNHSTFVNNVSTSSGGAIKNYGTLKVKGSSFIKNSATHDGGAIYSYNAVALDIQQSSFTENRARTGGALMLYGGSAKIKHSTFQENKVGFAGGAIHTRGTLLLSNSVLDNNSGEGGGGLINYGTLTLLNSTVANNQGVFGAGISNYGKLIVDRSTLSGNTASSTAGALYNSGSARLVNSTVSGNESKGTFSSGAINHSGSELVLQFVTIASNKGGSGALDIRGGGTSVENTIFWKNSASCTGTAFSSEGHNIADDRTCTGLNRHSDRSGTDAKLGPLADNGGPTLTHAPAADSPALGWAAPIAEIKTDQRGIKRPAKDPDIGAVEIKKAQ